MEINWNGSTLFYQKTGTGDRVLLLFHGFGQDHSVFEKLATVVSAQYTCFSFDLFFHGNSKWPDAEIPISKENWKDILEVFLKQESIDRFSLLGYSMGARFLLGALDAFPKQIRELILVAPDGIKMNIWYSIASYPWITRRIFKSMVSHPGSFHALASLAKNSGIVDQKVLRFAGLQMNTRERRERVYQTWVSFRKLNYNMAQIAEKINANGIPVTIYLAKHDHLIHRSGLSPLTTRLKDIEVKILDTGHNRLLELIPENFLSDIKGRSDNPH